MWDASAKRRKQQDQDGEKEAYQQQEGSKKQKLAVCKDSACLVEERIPDEVLCHILGMLPESMVAIAARTCRRWFACTLPSLRLKLSVRVMCSRLELLQWAVRNGYTMDKATCYSSAAQGQFEVLKWALENGCPWDKFAFWWAAHRGYLDMVKWLFANHYTEKKDIEVHSTHLEVLDWAHEHGFLLSPASFYSAAEGGLMEVMLWGLDHGHVWDPETSAHAASGGQLEMLKWARKKGYPWDEE
ncbi:Ankyrin repeat-containing protein, partial [Balamuthia mandrillaris]